MFRFNDYVNKQENIVLIEEYLNEEVLKEKTKSTVKEAQKANRNWTSMRFNPWEIVGTLLSISYEEIDELVNEISSTDVISIVDSVLLKKYGYTVNKTVAEVKKIKKSLDAILKNILDKPLEGEFKIDYEIAKDLSRVVIKYENILSQGSTPPKNWEEVYDHISSEGGFLTTSNIGEIPGSKGSALKSYIKSNDEETADAVVSIIYNLYVYYKNINALESASLETTQSTVARFWEMVTEVFSNGLSRGEFTNSLVNLYYGEETYMEMKQFSIVFSDYTEYIKSITEEVNKFVNIVDSNVRPEESYETQPEENKNPDEIADNYILLKWNNGIEVLVEENLITPSKQLIFLPSTYKKVKIIKEKNNEFNKFINATREAQMSSEAIAYRILSEPIKKEGILAKITKGIFSFLTGRIIGIGRDEKGRMLKPLSKTLSREEKLIQKRKNKSEEMMNKANFFRVKLEQLGSQKITDLFNLMLECLNEEAKRTPGFDDPTAAQAFDLLSEISSFVLDSGKRADALKYSETQKKAKDAWKAWNNLKTNIEETKINITNKIKVKETEPEIKEPKNKEDLIDRLNKIEKKVPDEEDKKKIEKVKEKVKEDKISKEDLRKTVKEVIEKNKPKEDKEKPKTYLKAAEIERLMNNINTSENKEQMIESLNNVNFWSLARRWPGRINTYTKINKENITNENFNKIKNNIYSDLFNYLKFTRENIIAGSERKIKAYENKLSESISEEEKNNLEKKIKKEKSILNTTRKKLAGMIKIEEEPTKEEPVKEEPVKKQQVKPKKQSLPEENLINTVNKVDEIETNKDKTEYLVKLAKDLAKKGKIDIDQRDSVIQSAIHLTIKYAKDTLLGYLTNK